MTCSGPALTENNLPSQSGKVFIVTGASAGLGKILTRILYQRHAKVYLAARSREKTEAAIREITSAHPNSQGTLVYLHLDLDDLSSIKPSAESFLAQESRLDVLWNNAGVMLPPEGSRTKQGYETQLGVNTIAPFLFALLLRDVMVRTAKGASKDSVRVAWVSSLAAVYGPKPSVDFENVDFEGKGQSMDSKYARAKGGACVLAVEFQRRVAEEGVVSVVCFSPTVVYELRRLC